MENLKIFFIVMAVFFFVINRILAKIAKDEASDAIEWKDGKVLLTGKNIGTYSTRYYGICYTDAGPVKGRTDSYKNKGRIDTDKEYDIQYYTLPNGRCIFRFTNPEIAKREVKLGKNRIPLILAIVNAALAVVLFCVGSWYMC